jgi:hypothetical protein
VLAQTSSRESSHFSIRVIKRIFVGPWKVECLPGPAEGCSVGEFFSVRFHSPAAVDSIAVAGTVSLGFRVSSGDFGRAILYYSRNGKPPYHQFAPGQFTLTSPYSKIATTTSLSWAAWHLPANGRVYYVAFSVNPRDGTGDTSVVFRANKATLLLTLTRG